MIALGVVALVIVLFMVDLGMNWDRAYGNISINGINVGGMTRQEITQTLKDDFVTPLSQAQVMIYADEKARTEALKLMAAAEEAVNNADSASVLDAEEIDFWLTDAVSLKAHLYYEEAVDQALDVGRANGGLFTRLSLTFQPVNIEMDFTLDENEVEHLAATIDIAIGDPRKDTNVVISRAWATVDEGHAGMMVDRTWLTDKLKTALMSKKDIDSFQAQLSNAPSRITKEQAELMCEQLNHALGCEADLTYNSDTYHASDIDLGNWTRVDVVSVGDGFALKPSLDSSRAIPAIVEGANARVTAEDTTCTFEKTQNGIVVHTAGTGRMPEVSAAVSDLNDELYGPNGYCYTDKEPQTIDITIGQSDRPESLPLERAIELGLVSKIGEFTTNFSNYFGTENRNHNIKLAADILNNGIIKANGGVWSFNSESGDTNEAAGFWAAGSIVSGEVIDSIGGGICQVATTIFNAVYEAGMTITERHNHTLYMANYPDGRDASVSYPDLNFTWRNDLDSDVLLVMSYTDTSITCTLYSVYTGYYAKSDIGEWKDGKEFGYRFKEDPTLATGAYVLKSEGTDGREITVKRTIYNAQGFVLFSDYFTSIYDPNDETYRVGPGTDTDELEKKLKEIQYKIDHPDEPDNESNQDDSTSTQNADNAA